MILRVFLLVVLGIFITQTVALNVQVPRVADEEDCVRQGTQGAVTSDSPIASAVGLRILESGGNAVDAAVATAFSLAVTYPSAGNLGGGGFMVIRLPNGHVVTNDHREKAPLGATRNMMLDAEGNYVAERALRSHLSAGVPGSVAGLLDVHERYGALKLAEILRLPIELAANGFALTEAVQTQLNTRKDLFEAIPSTAKIFVKDDDTTYRVGELFVQSDLAATLKAISEYGKSGFYTGRVADLIVAQMRENGGLITHEDLLTYESKWRDPVIGTYRDHTIYSMPPPSSGGVLIVQLLNMLEAYPITEWGFGATDTVHVMIESMRRAYADRAEHLGDPDFYNVPIDLLTDKDFARKRMADFDPHSATPSESIGAATIVDESPETTHLSVYQQDGMAVSYTTTINHAYGNGIVVDGAGFFLNNEMDDFSAKPGVPNSFGLIGNEANAIEPRKRMLSSMTPTIVTRDDDVVLITGSPGGSRIITTTLQVVVNSIDHEMELSDAVFSPRFHHQWLPDTGQFERLLGRGSSLTSHVEKALRDRGHSIRQEGRFFGRANSIAVRDETISVVTDNRGLAGRCPPTAY